MTHITSTANAFVRKLTIRAHLDENDVEALERATATVETVETGHDLVREGDQSPYTHVLLEGFACRHRCVPDGGRAIVAYLVPGDGCDLHASALNRSVYTVTTLTPCTVARVSYRAVKELAAYRPNVYLALWRCILVDELILQEWLVGVGRRPVDRQIAHFLCEILARLQAVGLAREPEYRMPVSQAELADTAGLSHVHAHRVLAELRKAGLIQSRRKGLVVPHLDRLKAFAGFDPTYLHLTREDATADPPQALSNATRGEFERRYGKA